MPEFQKREISHKLRIGQILRGTPAIETIDGKERFNFLELENKQIKRINVVANVIEKYVSEGESKFGSLTLDDASGQIRVKVFGDDLAKFEDIEQGATIIIFGFLRTYNNELYILPEIVKKIDPRYLLVRKLEIEKSTPKQEISKEETIAIKDQVLEMIKAAESTEGIDTEKLIMEIKATPETINQEITRLLEDGVIYEPRPGRVRFLG